MHAPSEILMTGATGFIGSHFLLRVLEKFPDVKIYAIVRGDTEEKRREKLLSSINKALDSYIGRGRWSDLDSRVVVVKGDIEVENFGLSESDQSFLDKKKVQFWHFAASLNYEVSRKGSIESKNINGAIHAVDVAARLDSSLFVYISTAYTFGASSGVVPEAIHSPDRDFSNFYEESKCRAEHVIAEACKRYQLQYSILRPSIVIGNSETKLPAGSDTGFYGIIIQLLQLREVIINSDSIVRIFGNPESKVNIIPVDDLTADIAYLIDNNMLGNGSVYHLCCDDSPTLKEMFHELFFGVGINNLVFCGRDGKISAMEKIVLQRTEFHSSYLASTKLFSRSLQSLCGRRDIAIDDVRLYVKEAVSEFSSHKSFALNGSGLKTTDGVNLNVYTRNSDESSDKPYVVVVNAHGMPVDFVEPICVDFSRFYNVLTWDIRGIPSDIDNDAVVDCSLQRHVQDLKEIVDSLGVKEFHLVGWCTGARVALEAVSMLGSQIKSLTLLNGAFFNKGVKYTAFEKANLKIMPLICRDPAMASRICESMYEQRSKFLDKFTVTGNVSASLVSGVSGDIAHLAGYPFRSSQSLSKYSRLINEIISSPVTEDLLGKVIQPTLIVTGNKDQTSSPDHSYLLHEKMPGSHLYATESGDHYSTYRDEANRDRIMKFMRSVEAIAS